MGADEGGGNINNPLDDPRVMEWLKGGQQGTSPAIEAKAQYQQIIGDIYTPPKGPSHNERAAKRDENVPPSGDILSNLVSTLSRALDIIGGGLNNIDPRNAIMAGGPGRPGVVGRGTPYHDQRLAEENTRRQFFNNPWSWSSLSAVGSQMTNPFSGRPLFNLQDTRTYADSKLATDILSLLIPQRVTPYQRDTSGWDLSDPAVLNWLKGGQQGTTLRPTETVSIDIIYPNDPGPPTPPPSRPSGGGGGGGGRAQPWAYGLVNWRI